LVHRQIKRIIFVFCSIYPKIFPWTPKVSLDTTGGPLNFCKRGVYVYSSLFLWSSRTPKTSLRISDLWTYALDQGCTTQISWRAKIFFDISKGQSLYVLTHSRSVFLSKKQAKKTKIGVWRARSKISAGHIWPVGRMLCMSALDQPNQAFCVAIIESECTYR